jgi:hypothetical protein
MMDFVYEVICPILLLLAIVFGIMLIPCIYQSEQEAELFNKTFGTNYTTSDFFWKSNLIKNYIENGKKYRVEISNK